MNEIPLKAISKGKDLGRVLQEYMRAYSESAKISASMGKSDDEVLSDATMCAVYRIYLLGVEDGMRRGTETNG